MDDTATRLVETLRDEARRATEFWLRHGVDHEAGGYWTDLGRDGSRYGEGEKWIIVQARTIYSFCLAYQWFGEAAYLQQAAQGVAFFREHFADRANGGWYYCLSRDGNQVLDDSKQPYGLAFGSYALAEYARLTGDRAALAEAAETQDLVMARCWDAERGGLPNRFSADWQLVEGLKRVDTHMHTMEGVSALYHATGEARYTERLQRLAETILGPIGARGCYDAANGCTHEVFHMDWSEALEATRGLVNFGHVTEAGWFIAKLAAYCGDAGKLRLATSLVGWALRFGYDTRRGGLYDYGRPSGEVVSDDKMWWNQAELLGALAFLYRLSRNPALLETLAQHLGFVSRHVDDATHGDWYPLVTASGEIATTHGARQDYKGSRWKSFYHVIQGLYHAYHDVRRAEGLEAVSSTPTWAEYCL
jgi:cellobiose epimerase